MHILVTNDDGVQAPGLLALAQAMRQVGDVTVVAPDRNWSASGHVKTLERPIRVTETMLADGTKAYMSDGAPSDCVALPLLGFLENKIDLVVSGINPFSNIGHDVTYSGTVTAAMEAVIAGVPGIAFSLASQDKPTNVPTDYGPAGEIAKRIVEAFVKGGFMEGVVTNVNIPYLSVEAMKGFIVTRQGMRVYRDALDRRVDPRGRPYYWIGGELPTGVNEEGTDVGALASGHVSITPLQLDLTNYKALETLRSWKWEIE